ncbi:unnamed protein product [Ranitomeya imitator]|uniref:Reverse transcriptase domain-containing protein n=1 Tax=Ranitomeya imitator TaxID=111125 RepID=A0ABN9M015_9NEOB|nr:unnamed protein product [Ranitomeya imitator]
MASIPLNGIGHCKGSKRNPQRLAYSKSIKFRAAPEFTNAMTEYDDKEQIKLSTTLSSTEWTNIKNKADKILAEYQKTLRERKRQKFQRDNEDYSKDQVYRWNNSYTTWHQPPNQRKQGSFSSSSDSSVETNRYRFLSKGRRGGGQHADQPDERGNRITTRSQGYVIPVISTRHVPIIPQRRLLNWWIVKLNYSHTNKNLVYIPSHPNLSPSEKTALKSLAENKEIIIKPADKVFLEKILTPLIRTTKSFMLDVGHFRTILKQLGSVSPDTLLVTLDVHNLYTSISHDKGIEATKFLLEDSDLSADSIQLCLDLLKLVLYENFFLYEDTFYNQKRGTAMGSNVAPAYANAFMNHFEIIYVFTHSSFQQSAICYHRFIDGIFLIWKGTPATLNTFHLYLNSIFPELQFTIHYDKDSVPFLDTSVIKNPEGHLQADLYCKPTDCNSLLHYLSCHPKTTRDNIPRSQFNTHSF